MLLPEGAALPVRGTEEKDIDPFQVHDIGKHEVRVAHQTGMVFRHGLPRLALRMDPGNLRRRMVHQKADEFAGGVAGTSDNTRVYHCSSG